MSRFSGMSSRKRRVWGYGVIVFFVLLIAAIGFSQWYAEYHNVPCYQPGHPCWQRLHNEEKSNAEHKAR